MKVIFGGVGAFCVVLWIFIPDLGLNIISEFLGVCFTVFVIDKLLQRREKVRLQPVFRSAARDLELIYGGALQIFVGGVGVAVREEELAKLKRVKRFSDFDVSEMLNRVSCNASSGVVNVASIGGPEFEYLTWKSFLIGRLEELEKDIDSFLLRYAGVVSPDVYSAVSVMQKSATFGFGKYLKFMNHDVGLAFLASLAEPLDLIAAATNADEDLAPHFTAQGPANYSPYAEPQVQPGAGS